MPTTSESGKTFERATDPFPRWVWLAGAGALLLIGWAFILSANGFHFTAPVVFVCLGYGAGVAAVYTLFRTGASAVSPVEDDDADDTGWDRPVGERVELEREKKALLKAIKEAEFDLQMGKLSKADAEAMIADFRARAIAVIRELDRKDGAEASVREQIEREVRARLEVGKGKKVAADAERRSAGKKGKKGQGAAAPASKQADAAGPVESAEAAAAAAVAVESAEPAAAVETEAAAATEPEAATAPAEAAAATEAEAATATEPEAAAAPAEAAAAPAEAAAEAPDDQTDSPDETAAAKVDLAPANAEAAAAVDPSNPEPRGVPQGAAPVDVAKEATS